jgi:putative protein kinase ArgK-like GTPase of G3E family
MLSVSNAAARQPRIVRVSCVKGEGIGALADEVAAHAQAAAGRRQNHARERTHRMLAQEAGNLVRERLRDMEHAELDRLCAALAKGELGHDAAAWQAIELAARNPV